MQGEEPQKEIIIKKCNHTRLAAAYGISPKVLRNWLRPYQHEIGKRKGYSYSLEQLFIIFEKIGFPPHPIQ
jgi:transposase-like protein